MVDMYQVVLGGIAVSIMVLVPIGCVLVWDLIAGRWDESIRRWKDKRAEDAEHRRGVRALRTQQGVPLEQLAADLRRLRALLGQDEHRSAAHQMGNRLAYDRLMMQICEMLGIEHELERRLHRRRARHRALPGRGRARAGGRRAVRPPLRPSGVILVRSPRA